MINAGGDFNHGFTYPGTRWRPPSAWPTCASSRKKKILERFAKRNGTLQKRLRELADHPLVGEVRGVGMLGAIELAKNKQTREAFPSEMGVGMVCRGHCFKTA